MSLNCIGRVANGNRDIGKALHRATSKKGPEESSFQVWPFLILKEWKKASSKDKAFLCLLPL